MIHTQNIHIKSVFIRSKIEIQTLTTDDHEYQSVAEMTRSKHVPNDYIFLHCVPSTSKGLMRRTVHTCDLKLGTQ